MRKVIVGAFVSLDGVMQAPGGPEEDPTGGFRFGGWMEPISDDVVGAEIGKLFAQPFDLLLGRFTYDIFAAHWPFQKEGPDAAIAESFNKIRKYVATHRSEGLSWANTEALGNDAIGAVRALKKTDGPALVTQGSATLVHQLLEHDLVDQLCVFTFPVVLGKGKRLFDGKSTPRAWKPKTSVISPKGAVVATYERGGDVAIGSFVTQPPSAVELERRAKLR